MNEIELLSFEDKVRVMKEFMSQVGPEESAKFMVRLQDTVDGQLANLKAYNREFLRMLNERKRDETTPLANKD